jgi:hypothetical protein
VRRLGSICAKKVSTPVIRISNSSFRHNPPNLLRPTSLLS